MSERIIYSFKSEGTMLPRYSSCEVYNTGRVILKSGSLLDASEGKSTYQLISKETVHKIERLIDDNSRIFAIKEVEGANDMVITDGSYETLSFSDGQRKNTLNVYCLGFREESPNTPDMNLLLKLHREIEEILKSCGIDENY